jgi:diaminopimelate epimerase
MFDNRDHWFPSSNIGLIEKLCASLSLRKTDGLILVEKKSDDTVFMNYFNNDGKPADMCGNGARATLYFAVKYLNFPGRLKLATEKYRYQGEVSLEQNEAEIIMNSISEFDAIEIHDLFPEALASLYVNTGVPHAVFEVKEALSIDILKVSPPIRFNDRFPKGANVGFYNLLSKDQIFYRSFERGVEDETLSCGTGVFAATLLFEKEHGIKNLKVETKGGDFWVRKIDSGYSFKSKIDFINQGVFSL